MKSELRNIDIDLISIVGKAANKTQFIFKSAGTMELPTSVALRNFDIVKKDDEKRLVYGLVYPVGKVDTQGDYANADEVEKACHNFMAKLDSTAKVDTGHNLQIAKDVKIVQCYIVAKGDELYPEDPGAWAIVVKVDNEEIWSQVKDGTFTGFSMYGTAERITNSEDITKEDLPVVKKFITLIKGLLNTDNNKMEDNKIKVIKDFNALVGTQDIQDYVWILSDSIRQVLNDENITDKKTQILTNIDQFKTKIDSINIAKSIVVDLMKGDTIDIEKAGKTLSEATLSKLNAAIDALNELKTNSETKTDNKVEPNIQKSIDEAVEKKAAELKKESDAKITELTATVETLKKENEELKKATPGSGQEPGKSEEVAKSSGKFNFLGLK